MISSELSGSGIRTKLAFEGLLRVGSCRSRFRPKARLKRFPPDPAIVIIWMKYIINKRIPTESRRNTDETPVFGEMSWMNQVCGELLYNGEPGFQSIPRPNHSITTVGNMPKSIPYDTPRTEDAIQRCWMSSTCEATSCEMTKPKASKDILNERGKPRRCLPKSARKPKFASIRFRVIRIMAGHKPTITRPEKLQTLIMDTWLACCFKPSTGSNVGSALASSA